MKTRLEIHTAKIYHDGFGCAIGYVEYDGVVFESRPYTESPIAHFDTFAEAQEYIETEWVRVQGGD